MTRFPHDPFGHGWYQAGYVDELQRGEARPFRAFGRDFVLWRGDDGTPHLMDAHCPHLGAHLGHGGRVEGTEIRCPFHGWTFDAAGACTGIPYAPGAALDGRRLAAWPVIERHGIVMAWWHPAGAAPGFDIAPIAEYGQPGWSSQHRHRWSIRSVWHEIQENLVDSAHLHYLHRVAGFPRIDIFAPHGPLLDIRMSQDFRTPRGLTPGFVETRLQGPYIAAIRFKIGALAETVFTAAVTPIEAELVELQLTFMARVAGLETPEMSRALVEEVVKQVGEDIPIWNHKAHRPSPSLAPGDGPIMKFRRWTEQFSATT
jgi:3-ketosteroid 9alpha-monooxygenase subunit A